MFGVALKIERFFWGSIINVSTILRKIYLIFS